MTFKTTLLAGTVLGAAALVAGAASAQTAQRPATTPAPTVTQAQIEALNSQIQALQGQLQSLKDQVGKDVAAVNKRVSDAPTVTVAGGRPRFVSADKAFDVALRARLHLDYGYWFPDNVTAGALDLPGNQIDLPDGFNTRRAYIGVAGKVFNDFNFELTADFSNDRGAGGRLQAANVSYTAIPGWTIDVGAMQPPFTLEDSTSSNDIPFIERSAPVNLATSLVASESRLALGFKNSGDRHFVSAYLTGDTLAASGGDDQHAVIGRAAFLAATSPDFDLGIGVTGGHLFEPRQTAGGAQVAANNVRNLSLSERPETRIGGGAYRMVSTGNIDSDSFSVYGGDVAFTFKNFWVAGEYYQYEFERRVALGAFDDPSFDGYYVAAGWFITGERRPYNIKGGNFQGPKVQWPFRTSGGYGPGAWELAARYSVIDLVDLDGGVGVTTPLANVTPTSGFRTGGTPGEQEVITLGLNWYLNSAVRLMFNYQMMEADRPGTQPTDETDAITARLQFQF
ncbi:MAG TPA: porin [Azospirillaceae bacterium]|nr:porin [Azospirillaceae bacterium]